MLWGLLLSALGGSALAYAYIREERIQVTQHRQQVSGGVTVPAPWGDVYDVPPQQTPVNSVGSAVEPKSEPYLEPSLNHPEPRFELSTVQPEPAQGSTGDGFPRFDQIESCIVGKFDPKQGGLTGADGEFLEWSFLYQQGLNQSSLIWRMWGAKKGGTERYKAAKARHDLFLKFIGDYTQYTENGNECD